MDLWDEDGTQNTEHNVIVVDKVPDKIVDHRHESFEWIFGRTPKFSKQFLVDQDKLVSVTVDKGLISEVSGLDKCKLVGMRYDPAVVSQFLAEIHKKNCL